MRASLFHRSKFSAEGSQSGFVILPLQGRASQLGTEPRESCVERTLGEIERALKFVRLLGSPEKDHQLLHGAEYEQEENGAHEQCEQ
jgi:hypothetical protein